MSTVNYHILPRVNTSMEAGILAPFYNDAVTCHMSTWHYNLNKSESVYSFTVNAKTTARIDAKCSGITKNNAESFLRRLKSPVLVLSGRYRDISSFPLRPFLLISTSGSCLDSFSHGALTPKCCLLVL